MDKQIIKQEEKSLSNSDILDLLNGKTKILTYTELTKYDDIDDILKPYGSCVILYLTKENYGHWTLIFKQKPYLLSFFDSYGYFPDEEIKFVPEYFREVSKQNKPHLTALLYNATKKGYKVEYNEYKYQKKKSNVRTCGRYVVARLMFRHLDNEEFHKLLTKDKRYNPDFYVTLLTVIM
jgi:hypothetical protein